MSITLKAGAGFIVVGPAGVTVSGIPILLNSGGAAGAGSGSSPEAPQPPKEADTAEPGEKDRSLPFEPPAVSVPSLPPVSLAQAQILREAAQSGMPFCEKCEALARLSGSR
jgi:type VI secretion system secreted protein VgrG